MFSFFRLIGDDDNQRGGPLAEVPQVTVHVQSPPSYAETAALPASGPFTATLTG